MLQESVKKTMIICSVGICQKLCYHENGYKFAVKVFILPRIPNLNLQVQLNSICM